MLRQRITATEGLLLLVGLGAITMMLRAVWIQGVGYDAPFETEAYLAIRDLGPVTTLQEAYDKAPITSEFYGLLTFQLTDLLARASGVPMSPDDLQTYLLHHYVVVALAVAASVIMGWATAVAVQSRIAGIFAATLLLVTPLWMGLGTMDYKDVPVAAGLTAVSAAMILAWRNRGSWTGILSAMGGFVALGTRAGSLLLIVGLVVGSLMVFATASIVQRNPRRLLRPAVTGTLAILGSGVGVWLTNPFARLDLPTWLTDSFEISREYIWVGVIRTAGMDLPSDQLPWWYAPAWLLAQLPVLTSTLLLISLIAGVGFLVARKRSSLRGRLVDIAPLAIQGGVLPITIVVSGAVLYDGIRHLLFALPGLISLTALPVAALTQAQKPRAFRVSAATGLGIVVALSFFACVRWFPYTYAFINPVAGSDRAERDWELDYWGLTAREGITRLTNPGGPAVAVVPAAEPGRPFGAVTAEVADAEAAATGRAHGVYVFRRWDAQFRQDWCTLTFTIQRDGQVLGEGGTCP